jgi:hypothetical protein
MCISCCVGNLLQPLGDRFMILHLYVPEDHKITGCLSLRVLSVSLLNHNCWFYGFLTQYTNTSGVKNRRWRYPYFLSVFFWCENEHKCVLSITKVYFAIFSKFRTLQRHLMRSSRSQCTVCNRLMSRPDYRKPVFSMVE